MEDQFWYVLNLTTSLFSFRRISTLARPVYCWGGRRDSVEEGDPLLPVLLLLELALAPSTSVVPSSMGSNSFCWGWWPFLKCSGTTPKPFWTGWRPTLWPFWIGSEAPCLTWIIRRKKMRHYSMPIQHDQFTHNSLPVLSEFSVIEKITIYEHFISYSK